MKKIFLGLLLTIGLFSCTENTMVKYYGGTGTLKLQPGEKLVNVTWKDAELWILTRSMTVKDSAISYNFREKSAFGLMEGNFTIIETKK